MNSRICSIALLLLIALLAPASALAKGRWYQVEVILFRHVFAATEKAVAPVPMPNYSDALSLVSDLPDFSDEPKSRPNEVMLDGPIAFQSLPRGELKMAGVFSRLRSAGEYEAVAHVGWRQPALGNARARRVYVSDRARRDALDAPLELNEIGTSTAQFIEGSVMLRSSRLLHLEANFLSYGAEAPVHINERRQVKLKELHYFDNPYFGVIVQVTPFHVDGAAFEQDEAVSDEP